ncbi:MAG: tRNA uridine-5-carboxymethylaminomethyl(34) synthesis GTPase MnmE [Candidatus Euphemobacter frigidus]|nr:tRNA uridine-5-carboxymethylaminomethyl(34) synthesis GTPase MnmE [Candidatus Euphemobacter frigidus]MDP8276419.1 tRNA uridine-5-carboxymethylaminomethyl(34) synthesis GTPase MnmE [Candidatus Euphemobacter frigidus]
MIKINEPETITAVATPDGEGAIGVIRISGPRAFAILKAIFHPRKKADGEMSPFHLYRGWIKNGAEEIDDAMVAVMKKPRSYTGEDMVEIYSHGGRAVSAALLNAVIARGARPAEPGEFTRRAFLNGKMDLTRAESVAWLISARSEAELKCAVGQLKGDLRERLLEIKRELVRALSLVEVTLDFDEYENILLPSEEIKEIAERALAGLKKLHRQARAGSCLRDGIRVVIVGKPNVGKSSLLNTFLSQKRAIVSHQPGTTRDTIEEVIRLDGIPLRLIDTAGIRPPRGEIEREGVNRAKEKVRVSDLVLLVLDSGTRISKDDLEILRLAREKRALLVINKSDLPERVDLDRIRHELHRRKVIKISAARNWGIERLREEIIALIREDFMGGESAGVMISHRRKEALGAASRSIEHALLSLDQKLSGEFIALDLNRALGEVRRVLGEEYGDEVLDEIFSRFCVGK